MVNDHRGAGIGKNLADSRRLAQVIALAEWYEDALAAAFDQQMLGITSQESIATGKQNTLFGPVHALFSGHSIGQMRK